MFRMRWNATFLFIFIFFTQDLFGADKNRFLLKPFIRRSSLGVDHQLDGNTFKYSPNIGSEAGSSFSYGPVAFEISTMFKPAPLDIELKGESKSSKFMLAWLGDFFSLEIFHMDFKNFHLANPGDVGIPRTRDDPYPQYPNMKLQSTAVNMLFVIFPQNFSLPALYQQTKRQTRSGISPLFEFGGSSSNIDNIGAFKSLNINELHLLAGFGATIAFGSPFFSLAAMAGPNYQVILLEDALGEREEKQSSLHYNGKLGFGWNGDSVIGGLNLNAEQQFFQPASKQELTMTRTIIESYVGYRF